MYIKSIEWLNEGEKEAIVKVTNDIECLLCFCYPCFYNIRDILTEPLECLDTNNIVLCEIIENSIQKIREPFKYRLKGKMKNVKNGIVKVSGFNLHIDEEQIPNDIVNEMYIQFVVSRIDIW